MAQNRVAIETSFEADKVIEPIYSGGVVALSGDGRLLATTLGEDALLTDLANGQRLAKVEGDDEAITTLALTSSGSHLILCSRSLSMRICSLERQEPSSIQIESSRTLKPHGTPIVTTAIDETDTLLATGAADGTTKVWDIKGAYATHTFHGPGSVVTSLCLFEVNVKGSSKKAAGYRLATGYEDGKVRIWNLETRRNIANLDSHVSVVRALDFDPTSKTLVSTSRDKTIAVWNISDWKSPPKTIPALESIETACFLRSDLLVTGGDSGQLRLWRASIGKEVASESENKESEILQTCFCPSANLILSVHADLTLQVHSVKIVDSAMESGGALTLEKRISGTHDEVIDFGLVGREKNYLAVATNVEDVKVLSLRSHEGADENDSHYFGSDVGILRGHEDIVICLDVDWSGSWIVSGAKDNTAKLWRVDPTQGSYTCVTTFTGHAGSIGAISVPHSVPSAESSAYATPLQAPPAFVITGSQDKTVKHWTIAPASAENQQSNRATYTRKAHDKDINAIDISYDSKLFASASQDRTVKIWAIEDGGVVGVLRGHRRGVWSVKFSPSGVSSIASEGSQVSSARGYALTGSGDKTVRIWSLSDYTCLRTFEGHTNSVLKVAWMNIPSTEKIKQPGTQEAGDSAWSKHQAVVSAAGDGLVKVWDVSSEQLSTTLDNHTDRVWALLIHPSTNTIISGGGDGVITCWKDTTSIKAAANVAATSARIEEDQRLQNFMRNGSYREAITLALQLNHPSRLLALLTAAVGTYPQEKDSLCGVKAVDEVITNLSEEQLVALLNRLRDWNANTKTAPVAQRVLWAILHSYPPSQLLALGRGKSPNITEILDGLRVYTERHYTRMEDLINDSYIVDYMLQEHDQITGTADMHIGTLNGYS